MKQYCLLLAFLLTLPASAENIKVTILVDATYKPFSYQENNEAKGMYIDVLRTAFSRMQGFTVTMEPVPWQRGKHMMEKGDELGLAPAFFHGHDWPYLYPYSLPFHTETIIAVCGGDILASPRPAWPEDYIGLTIGNVAGFDGWGGEAFHSLVKQNKIRIAEAKGSDASILKLAEGRVDCIMMEDRAFDYEFRKIQQKGLYTKGMKPLKKGAIIGTDPVYIGYSKPAREQGKYPYQFEFMQAFDSEIYKMTKSGEIEKIMSAYQD